MGFPYKRGLNKCQTTGNLQSPATLKAIVLLIWPSDLFSLLCDKYNLSQFLLLKKTKHLTPAWKIKINILAFQSSPAYISVARLSKVWTIGAAACWHAGWQHHLGCSLVDWWLFFMKCLKWLISQSQQNHVFSVLSGKCMAALVSCTLRIFVIRKQVSCVLLWITCVSEKMTHQVHPQQLLYQLCVVIVAADWGCVSVCIHDCWCWWWWCGWVERPTTARRHLPLRGWCSPCPSHSLWEEAGCRRRPPQAAAPQQAQGLKLDSALWKTSLGLRRKQRFKEMYKSQWEVSEASFFCPKQPEIFKPANSQFA